MKLISFSCYLLLCYLVRNPSVSSQGCKIHIQLCLSWYWYNSVCTIKLKTFFPGKTWGVFANFRKALWWFFRTRQGLVKKGYGVVLLWGWGLLKKLNFCQKVCQKQIIPSFGDRFAFVPFKSNTLPTNCWNKTVLENVGWHILTKRIRSWKKVGCFKVPLC